MREIAESMFDTYSDLIKSLHAKGMVDPIEILKKLFEHYLSTRRDKLSLFATVDPHAAFCAEHLTVASIQDLILALNGYAGFKTMPQGCEFAELLNAFFSCYRKYADPLAPDVRAKLSIRDASILDIPAIIESFLRIKKKTKVGVSDVYHKIKWLMEIATTIEKRQLVTILLSSLVGEKKQQTNQYDVEDIYYILGLYSEILTESQLKIIIPGIMTPDAKTKKNASYSGYCNPFIFSYYNLNCFSPFLPKKLLPKMIQTFCEQLTAEDIDTRNHALVMLVSLVDEISSIQWPLVIDAILKQYLLAEKVVDEQSLAAKIEFITPLIQKIPKELQTRVLTTLTTYLDAADPSLQKAALLWLKECQSYAASAQWAVTFKALLTLMKKTEDEELKDLICKTIMRCACHYPKELWSEILPELLLRCNTLVCVNNFKFCANFIPAACWPEKAAQALPQYFNKDKIKCIAHITSYMPQSYWPDLIKYLPEKYSNYLEAKNYSSFPYELEHWLPNIPKIFIRQVIESLLDCCFGKMLSQPEADINFKDENLQQANNLLQKYFVHTEEMPWDKIIKIGNLLLQNSKSSYAGHSLLLSVLPCVSEKHKNEVISHLLTYDKLFDHMRDGYDSPITRFAVNVPRNLWPKVYAQLIKELLKGNVYCQSKLIRFLEECTPHMPFDPWPELISTHLSLEKAINAGERISDAYGRHVPVKVWKEMANTWITNPKSELTRCDRDSWCARLRYFAEQFEENQWPSFFDKLIAIGIDQGTILAKSAPYIPASQWTCLINLIKNQVRKYEEARNSGKSGHWEKPSINAMLRVCIQYGPGSHLSELLMMLTAGLKSSDEDLRSLSDHFEFLFEDTSPHWDYPQRVFFCSYVSTLVLNDKDVHKYLCKMLKPLIAIRQIDDAETELLKYLPNPITKLVMQYQ